MASHPTSRGPLLGKLFGFGGGGHGHGQPDAGDSDYRDKIDALRQEEEFQAGWRELVTALLELTRGAHLPSPRAVRKLLGGT